MNTATSYGSKAIYKHFVKTHGNVVGGVKITQKLCTEVQRTFFDTLFNQMIMRNLEYTIPCRLGTLSITKRQTNLKLTEDGKLDTSKLKLDFNALKELRKEDPKTNKRVYHLNEHTEGYYFRYYWSKLTCLVPNHTAYSLSITRRHKRELSTTAKDTNLRIDFYEAPTLSKYGNSTK